MSRTFTVIASTFLLACDSGSDPRPRNTLTLAMRLDGGLEGMVSIDPPGVDCLEPLCSVSFEPGTTVTLTADPEGGRFIRWGGACTGTALTCTVNIAVDQQVEAVFLTANYVFVTSTLHAPDLGGLAQADALCQARADAAALPGTYKAWLSTSAVHARDRLGSARGWVRTDGNPFGDSVQTLLDGQVFYPPWLDERGAMAFGMAFTGTDAEGRSNGLDCAGWTSTSASESVILGDPSGGARTWTASGGTTCDNEARLLCLGTDAVAPVAPTPVAGRMAFVTVGMRTGDAGLAGLDALCASEATAAGLPGSYLAAVATSTHSMAARFDAAGGPWVRHDGVAVTASGDLSLGPLAPIDLHADGTPSAEPIAWVGQFAPQVVGTADRTCLDWSTASAAAGGWPGAIGSASQWLNWGPTSLPCDQAHPVFCLQE